MCGRQLMLIFTLPGVSDTVMSTSYVDVKKMLYIMLFFSSFMCVFIFVSLMRV